jgi:hypothetical protein
MTGDAVRQVFEAMLPQAESDRLCQRCGVIERQRKWHRGRDCHYHWSFCDRHYRQRPGRSLPVPDRPAHLRQDAVRHFSAGTGINPEAIHGLKGVGAVDGQRSSRPSQGYE